MFYTWKQNLLSDWNAKHCVLFSNKCCMFSVSAASATATASPSFLSRPMQRKLVSLVNCQLIEEEGRSRAVKAARSLGERTVMELILLHQNPQQLSANLWAAVRARGCQFLGPGRCNSFLLLALAPFSLFWVISLNSVWLIIKRENSQINTVASESPSRGREHVFAIFSDQAFFPSFLSAWSEWKKVVTT